MGAQATVIQRPFRKTPYSHSIAMAALLGSIPGADGLKKKALEEGMKQAEQQVGEMAPPYAKVFFPCCGGPVDTLKKFEFAVPADKKDNFNKLFDQYQKQKTDLKKM